MRPAAAMVGALLCASCAAQPHPPPSPTAVPRLDLARFQSPQPEFGLTSGPDGWYLSRRDGPFGSDARSRLWRFPFGEETGVPAPEFFHGGRSVSDFSYAPLSGRAYYVVDGDIHSAHWTKDGWELLGPVEALNTPGYEASPQPVGTGLLYFASDRAGGLGQGDLYLAQWRDDRWQVEPLGPEVNSPTGEWNLAVSADHRVMVFEASGRETNRSGYGDLYFSCRTGGKWQAAAPLTALNTDGSDLDFRFTGLRSGVFSSALVGGDAVLRSAGPEHFAACR